MLLQPLLLHDISHYSRVRAGHETFAVHLALGTIARKGLAGQSNLNMVDNTTNPRGGAGNTCLAIAR